MGVKCHFWWAKAPTLSPWLRGCTAIAVFLSLPHTTHHFDLWEALMTCQSNFCYHFHRMSLYRHIYARNTVNASVYHY